MCNKPNVNSDLKGDEFLLKVYEEVCTNIRTSDDISFKLLGLVPVLSSSGAAILTLSKIWSEPSSITILLLSFVAIAITFGVFKWEMRNVQKCNWLIERAAEIEQSYFQYSETNKINISQFYNWESETAPPLFATIQKHKPNSDQNWFKKPIGKTQAENIIYWFSIFAWLIPIGTVLSKWEGFWLRIYNLF